MYLTGEDERRVISRNSVKFVVYFYGHFAVADIGKFITVVYMGLEHKALVKLVINIPFAGTFLFQINHTVIVTFFRGNVNITS
jgi:hypothetical protein